MISAQSNDGFEKHIFASESGPLPYRLLKPVSHAHPEGYPLIVFLHGAGERGDDNESQIKHIQELFLDPAHREKYPCYVVAPQCPKGEMWARFDRDARASRPPTMPMQRLIKLIDEVVARYDVDRSRIYVTGVSMGGFGTWDLLGRFPQRFAAAVPICGGGDPSIAADIKHIPIWVFHGAKDAVVLPRHSRQMVSALEKVGGDPLFTEYRDVAHNSWEKAYREPKLLPWLFRHSKAEQRAN